MDYLLIQILRKNDNGQKSKLQAIFKAYGSLLIEPQQNQSIRLDNDEIFYVEYVRQDLKNNAIILYQYIDICHREFWDEKFWDTYLMAKIGLGWKKVPKNWKYDTN